MKGRCFILPILRQLDGPDVPLVAGYLAGMEACLTLYCTLQGGLPYLTDLTQGLLSIPYPVEAAAKVRVRVEVEACRR